MPRPANLNEVLDDLDAQVNRLGQHGGSRYVGPGADPEVARHVAAGGSVEYGTGRPMPFEARDYADRFSTKTVQPRLGGGGEGGSIARELLNIAQHRTDHLAPVHSEKALAESVDSSGGFLLTIELAKTVMSLIRNRVAVTQLPITVVERRSKLYELIGLSTTPTQASAAWLTENSLIPYSAQSFSVAAQMVPRPLGSLVAISNRLLLDAISDNPLAAGAAEDVIQRDLADLMAVSLNAALIEGDASGPAPSGLLRLTGTTALPGGTIPTNGTQVSYGLLVAIVSALRAANMPFSTPGWIFNARTLASLQNLTDSLGDPLLAKNGLITIDANGGGGTLLGFPFKTTNAIPNNQAYGSANNASTIIFSSEWNEAYLGNWQAFALDSSQEATYDATGSGGWVSAFQSMQTVFRATIWADFCVRRPAAFVVAGGILP
jgi:HK97 family phage major capsid protein